jgi:hypothetical protein
MARGVFLRSIEQAASAIQRLHRSRVAFHGIEKRCPGVSQKAFSRNEGFAVGVLHSGNGVLPAVDRRRLSLRMNACSRETGERVALPLSTEPIDNLIHGAAAIDRPVNLGLTSSALN